MTIASLTTAATPAPAPKSAASPVQTAPVAADAQTAALSSEPPVASNLELAITAARQSAAARQDGLSVLMANLLRATATGSLPMPVQQAADQLLALHLPTDVAPDAATLKSALLTSGLFTEANVASSAAGIPIDVKTALLQLNNAAETWLARAAPDLGTPVSHPASMAARLMPPPAVAAQTALPATPPPREPTRRLRINEPAAKPVAPNAAAPQRDISGKSTRPLETSAPTDTAPDTETNRPASEVLGRITQVMKSTSALPQEVKAALVLVSKAIASAVAAPEATAASPAPTPDVQPAPPRSIASAPQLAQTAPSTPTAEQEVPATKAPPQSLASGPQQQSPASSPALPSRGSSPVEQLLALQLAPAPDAAVAPTSVATVLPDARAESPADVTETSSSLTLRQPNTPPAPTGVAIAVRSSANSPSETFSPPLSDPAKPLPAASAKPADALVPPMRDAAPPMRDTAQSVQLPDAPLQRPTQQAPSQQLPSQPSSRLAQQSSPQEPLPQPSLQPSSQQPSSQQPSSLQSSSQQTSSQQTSSQQQAPQQRPAPPPQAPAQQLDVAQQPSVPPQSAPAELTAAISVLTSAGLVPPAVASGVVPNDLRTLLALFNMAAENWLPPATPGATSPGTPRVPPPMRGVPSKGQPASLPTLPANADTTAIAKQLLSGSDAALARQTLLQIASLPDAASQSRPADARWVFDLPLMTPQGAAVAQMIIERDTSGTTAEKPTPVWRVQFAIDIEPLGPVHANLALSGDRAWVTISADRPESLDRLQSGVSWLADALQATELDADIAFQSGRAPPLRATASRFMDHAS